ncbi:hypothetical protein A2U01_0104550 [Trifolium medium]|uniref:Uncharacterized protein n=1 Tax=Trifolium medium TaxID=97028 RepID=A0A392V8V3_9FABA|nr:hypothetical protein [Trifolium medium]
MFAVKAVEAGSPSKLFVVKAIETGSSSKPVWCKGRYDEAREM